MPPWRPRIGSLADAALTVWTTEAGFAASFESDNVDVPLADRRAACRDHLVCLRATLPQEELAEQGNTTCRVQLHEGRWSGCGRGPLDAPEAHRRVTLGELIDAAVVWLGEQAGEEG
jgi:hypothetical protein